MLRELRIFNIILIESSVITFQRGLNVITGETGSGKSAVMHALGFISGARSDISLIRKGCDKGAVEAAFDIEDLPNVLQLLDSAGIEHVAGNDLIIRREIAAGGKSRAFINNQMVQLTLLKMIGEQLIGLLAQHANQNLLSTTYHRQIVNIYGRLETATADFGKSWKEELQLKDRLDKLIGNEAGRLRSIESYSRELKELKEADVKDGEDEELYAEYSLLSNAEELSAKASQLHQGFNGDRNAILPFLQRIHRTLQELTALDPTLSDCEQSFANAVLEIQEIAHTLSTYQSRIEYDPIKIEKLNDRLSLINSLKKRYGATVSEINNYINSITEKLNDLENADLDIEKLTAELQIANEKNHAFAKELTDKRKHAAGKFQTSIAKELKSLNMPKVEFFADILSQKRDHSGDDTIEFFLQPNVGEHKIPLKGCASGGELSRVLLALHTVLAGKDGIPTIVFDEIDSNIGGETANVVGEKLKKISSNQQVICITHFPQVARHATRHLQISKTEKSGRTVTNIQQLDDSTRQHELARMLGGNVDLLDAMAHLL
jgi:DNA repair protein RecN (Recombination protein N)